jgi:AraC-like DNA-binding protein
MNDQISCGTVDSPFFVEFARRKERFTMPEEHFHTQYEIYYLFSGERNYFIRDRTYSVRSGDLVFINKYELHKTSDASGLEHERLLINFTEAFLRDTCGEYADLLLRPFHVENPVYSLKTPSHYFENTFATMLEELNGQPPGYEFRLKYLLTEVLLLAARHANKQQAVQSHTSPPIHEKISEIAQYVGRHFSDDLSLSRLAERFHISPFYLSRTFKAVTGFTLSEYIHSVRIRQAQKFLKETNLSVTEISARSGFDNFSHFGKIFKKIARVSPRDYRNLGAGNNE